MLLELCKLRSLVTCVFIVFAPFYILTSCLKNWHSVWFASDSVVTRGRSLLWIRPGLEVEVMNSMVALKNQPSRMDLGTRQWVWGAFFGLKKEYRFLKNVKGTALVMTRLFDPHHQSPYSDVLNVRIMIDNGKARYLPIKLNNFLDVSFAC